MSSISIPPGDLLRLTVGILRASGYPEGHAKQTGELLVWANARDVASHGVLRLPRYLEMVRDGQIKPAAKPRIVNERGAMAIVEADRAPGAVGMNFGVEVALRLAHSLSIGWCSIRNISHAGAIGYFAGKLAKAGCIGIVMTASKPLMTYCGSRTEALSTNPLAIAAPSQKGLDPVVLDMSTSAVALGKIMAARSAGRAIPMGWGVDDKGADTTDARSVKSLLPMAGAKGSGLSLMIEILSSVLVANPIISTVLNGTGEGSMNGIVLAIDIAAFGDPTEFRDEIATLVRSIKALPKADGVTEIFLPGERGAVTTKRAELSGIELEDRAAKDLTQLATKFGLELPEALEHQRSN